MTIESVGQDPVSLPTHAQSHAPPDRGAFTLVEVLAMLAILAVLGCLILPALARTTTQTKIAQCEANLKQDLLAMLQFAGDNGDYLPDLFPVTSGNWPWDMAATAEYKAEPYGMHRTQLYDPGFPNQNIDQMWNFSVAYNSQGVPISGYRATGYAFAVYGGSRVVSDDQNSSIATQILAVSGNDPQLTQTVPAVNGLIKINPARRVLVTDTLISYANQTDPTQYQTYTWALHSDVGYPGLPSWSTTPYGPWNGSSSSHLSPTQLPVGSNEGMLDGHVKWIPFPGMTVHTVPNPQAGDCFWWQSDPAKL